MTRLTDEQVRNAASEAAMINGAYTEAWLRNFADRIAALAVQEVERERQGVQAALNAVMDNRQLLKVEVATLTAQLAEVQESLLAAHKQLRSFGVEPKPPLGFAPNGHAGSRSWFEAALAEVTKERDAHREQSRINDEVALCYRRDWQQAKAQLATAKREALVPCRECAGSGLVPATPSGELCDADCGCKAPEAREEDSEFLLRVVQEVNAYAVITPADAKRIVRLAAEARDAE